MASHPMPAIDTLRAPSPLVASVPSGALPLTTAPPVRASNAYQRFGKPLLDCSAAFLGLVLLLPVTALVALIVRIDLGPGVLFRQRRVGLRGREFTVLKFRTMLHEARPAPGRALARSTGTNAPTTRGTPGWESCYAS